MYSPYILRYRYCRHVTLDVFWLKGEKAFRNVETLFSFYYVVTCCLKV